MLEKTCTKCKIVKALEDYNLDRRKSLPDNRRSMCIECTRANRREYNRVHSNRRSEYCRRNREKINAYSRERYANDPVFRANRLERATVHDALKVGNNKKRFNARRGAKLLGCTYSEFKAHIEKQFVAGMSWDNYGKRWNIDHKIPCSQFDLTKEDALVACFNYKNTQPMFVISNHRKAKKVLQVDAPLWEHYYKLGVLREDVIQQNT